MEGFMRVAVNTELMKRYGRGSVPTGRWTNWLKRGGADSHAVFEWCAEVGADFRQVIIEDTRGTKRIEYRRDIVDWMTRHKVTRKELARKLGVTPSGVGAMIKRGKMSAKNAYKLDNLNG